MMANLTSMTIAGASNGNRKQMVHEADRMAKAMQAAKLPGDHVLLTFDDGTTQQVVISGHDIHSGDDGITINFTPGVVS